MSETGGATGQGSLQGRIKIHAIFHAVRDIYREKRVYRFEFHYKITAQRVIRSEFWFFKSHSISVNLHHDQFRIVVDPYGQNAVSETSRNDLLHAADIVHSLIHLGEDLELG